VFGVLGVLGVGLDGAGSKHELLVGDLLLLHLAHLRSAIKSSAAVKGMPMALGSL
jgi:hypothetical protein